MKKGFLLLEDGTVIEGYGIGRSGTVYGELVFNTAMSGYEEAFTDPSFAGQILLMTYPLIGNYGFTLKHRESDGVKIRGLVIKEPAFFSARYKRITKFLIENKIPCIWGVDTRSITLRLRNYGTMKALLVNSMRKINFKKLLAWLKRAPHPHHKNLVQEVSCKGIIYHRNLKKRRIVVIDCGVKKSILRNLLKYATVIQVPYDTDFFTIRGLKPHGIVVSNGPGDPEHPEVVAKTVSTLKPLLRNYPVMGICLGHQLIGVALGLKTFKMKFGHRGYNHPVKNTNENKIYITSQNHGYALVPNNSVDIEFNWINLNDATVEGLRHRHLPVFSVQFHPEASPGPFDTTFLFSRFMDLIDAQAHRP